MKITIMTALTAALAFAPMAQAQEGNGEPFPFRVGPIGAVQFIDGVAVAMPDQPAPAYAARDEAPLQPATDVAELPAEQPAELTAKLDLFQNDTPGR